MENDNYYVGSRGLLKSCNYFSSNPISSIRRMAFYPELKTINHMKNPIIYVCNSAILHFNTIMPYIDFSFVLVSGDSDDTMPYDILKPDAFETFISNPFLLHWFSQNMTINHAKITKIPIGMDYHTMCTKVVWGPITTPKNQEFLLNSIRKIPFYERFYEKDMKCYANFHFQMNTKYGKDRQDAIAEIPADLVYYEPTMVSRLKTWNTQKEYAFVISPHGGGYDCHRLWEALILGCIPIVKTSPIDNLYEGLPVLIVKEWSHITIDLLTKTIVDFKEKEVNKEFIYEKLSLQYWINKFKSF
jgi:hypothetical protein